MLCFCFLFEQLGSLAGLEIQCQISDISRYKLLFSTCVHSFNLLPCCTNQPAISLNRAVVFNIFMGRPGVWPARFSAALWSLQ